MADVAEIVPEEAPRAEG